MLRSTDRLLFIVSFLVFAWVVFRNAWMSDDIYITFRTLYNWDHGYGLTWNVTERVQTFTHPLWLLVLAPAYFIVGHAYYVGLGMGMLFSALAVGLLPRVAGSFRNATILLWLLIASRSFIDFSTSGLENPLSHFLLLAFVGFVASWFKEGSGVLKRWKGNFIVLGLLASLLMLNRMDLLLLIAPILGYLFWQDRSWRNFGRLALGFLPLIIWELFALIYYGFPFPNTYYAKAMTGFPRSWLLEQGLSYLWDSLLTDPIVLPLILLATVMGVTGKRRWVIMLVVGMWLYLLYIVWIGGDFMSGRFMTVPFLMAVAVMAVCPMSFKRMAIAAGASFLLAIAQPYHPLKTGKDYYSDRRGNERELYASGIVDEKGMAWARTSLQRVSKESEVLAIERAFETWGPDPGKITAMSKEVAVGLKGYSSGPNLFIVDELALTDPLLARLPSLRVPYWRIGHFWRRLPAGYWESLGLGVNQIVDPDLKEYYTRLELVTRGPIWSWDRFGEILRFNLGMNSHLIPEEKYQTPTPAERDRFK